MYMMKWEATSSVADQATLAEQLRYDEALTGVNWDAKWSPLQGEGEGQIPEAYLTQLQTMLTAARVEST